MYPFKTFYSLKKPSEVVKKHFTKLKIILIHASNIERCMCCSMEIENFIQALKYWSVGNNGPVTVICQFYLTFLSFRKMK